MRIRTPVLYLVLALLTLPGTPVPAYAQQALEEHADPALANKPDYLSDTALTAQVRTALLAKTGLDSMKIQVETTDGVVTLRGEVPDTASIALASQVAQQVEGVRQVRNELAPHTPS